METLTVQIGTHTFTLDRETYSISGFLQSFEASPHSDGSSDENSNEDSDSDEADIHREVVYLDTLRDRIPEFEAVMGISDRNVLKYPFRDSLLSGNLHALDPTMVIRSLAVIEYLSIDLFNESISQVIKEGYLSLELLLKHYQDLNLCPRFRDLINIHILSKFNSYSEASERLQELLGGGEETSEIYDGIANTIQDIKIRHKGIFLLGGVITNDSQTTVVKFQRASTTLDPESREYTTYTKNLSKRFSVEFMDELIKNHRSSFLSYSKAVTSSRKPISLNQLNGEELTNILSTADENSGVYLYKGHFLISSRSFDYPFVETLRVKCIQEDTKVEDTYFYYICCTKTDPDSPRGIRLRERPLSPWGPPLKRVCSIREFMERLYIIRYQSGSGFNDKAVLITSMDEDHYDLNSNIIVV